MKKTMILLLVTVLTGVSQFAIAEDSGPEIKVLKSIEYLGKIVSNGKQETNKVCKLTINLAEFSNLDHPQGPIKYQYVDFRLSTGRDLKELSNKPLWQDEVISRTNVKNQLSYSETSALPMNLESTTTTAYNGHTLYKKEKRNAETYSGKTEMWINNVSPNVFDSKPTEVRVLKTGGNFFSTTTESDFSCGL